MGPVPYTPQKDSPRLLLSSNVPRDGRTGRITNASTLKPSDVVRNPRPPSKARRRFGPSRSETNRPDPNAISCRPSRAGDLALRVQVHLDVGKSLHQIAAIILCGAEATAVLPERREITELKKNPDMIVDVKVCMDQPHAGAGSRSVLARLEATRCQSPDCHTTRTARATHRPRRYKFDPPRSGYTSRPASGRYAGWDRANEA